MLFFKLYSLNNGLQVIDDLKEESEDDLDEDTASDDDATLQGSDSHGRSHTPSLSSAPSSAQVV